MIWFLDANICLDLLDTTRPHASRSVAWYMVAKEERDNRFVYAADAMTTLFYILRKQKKLDPLVILSAIEAMSEEIEPIYPEPADFAVSKSSMREGISDDFEDMMALSTADRIGADRFLTWDRELLEIGRFGGVEIVSVGSV